MWWFGRLTSVESVAELRGGGIRSRQLRMGGNTVSNVKRVHITGSLPYNCSEHHDLASFLATMNGPTFGFKVQWGHDATYKPNPGGGRTAMYPFTVTGHEAVAVAWVEALLTAIVNAGGEVTSASVQDIENNFRPRLLKPPATAKTNEFVVTLAVAVRNPEALDWAMPTYDVAAALKARLRVSLADDPRAAIHLEVDPTVKSVAQK